MQIEVSINKSEVFRQAHIFKNNRKDPLKYSWLLAKMHFQEYRKNKTESPYLTIKTIS
jgi:hypothetical protein